MRKLGENREDIQKLEEDIRKLGVPYSGSEPDPLYWANFRVRVMDRIEARQKQAPWPTRIMEFLAEHVLAASISVAAACLLVAVFLAFQPTGPSAPQLAAVTPAVVPPSQLAQPASAPPALGSEPVTSPAKETLSRLRSSRTELARTSKNEAKAGDDLAVAEPFAASSSDQAISLESLSQGELESVLADIQSDTSDN